MAREMVAPFHETQAWAEPETERREALMVSGLSKVFGSEQVLDHVSFSIAEGESLVLLGPSGSGKSTTLRLFAGLETPDSGEIFLRGKRIEHLRARDRNLLPPTCEAGKRRPRTRQGVQRVVPVVVVDVVEGRAARLGRFKPERPRVLRIFVGHAHDLAHELLRKGRAGQAVDVRAARPVNHADGFQGPHHHHADEDRRH